MKGARELHFTAKHCTTWRKHTFRPAACNLGLEVQSKRFEGKVFFVVDNELSVDDRALRACPGEHQSLDLLVIALTC